MSHQIEKHNGGRTAGADLTRHVESLLAALHPPVSVERRHYSRSAASLLFQLTPLNDEGEPVHNQTMTVVGKDISRRGVSFFHDQPLPYRRAILSWERPEFGCFSVEVDVSWCRFNKPGWYVSGGRLLRTVRPEPRASNRHSHAVA